MGKLNFVIGFFLVFILQACQNTVGGFTAGFLVHTLDDERWAIERDIFTKRVKELGGNVLFENAQQDERMQLHLAEKMIESGIDVLVVVPVNSKTAASIARLCEKNKVKLIAYDIMIDNCKPDLFISFDNIMIGEMMASYAISKQPAGNYVLLWGDGGMNVAQWVKEGQLNVLNKYIDSNKIKVVYKTYVENWGKEEASHLAERVFDFSINDIDVVIASSDGIADGVIQSLKKRNAGKYPLITGQDASQGALQNIKEGFQSMTIFKPFDKMAIIAADAAYNLASGKPVKSDTMLFNGRDDIPSILLKPSLIDKSNINQLVAGNK